MSVYAFRSGPTYRGASPNEQFNAAFDMPLSVSSTLGEQFKGGILDSLGLGTGIREAQLPDEAPTEPTVTMQGPDGQAITLPDTPQMRRRATVQGIDLQPETPDQFAQRRRDVGSLNEDQFKASQYFREGVKWDMGMTEDRAAALAEAYDAKKVREYFASKRPFTAFVGNLAGQAIDPINYIPIAGPAVKAANVAKFGRIGGGLATGSLDAAANTALASAATFDVRKSMGDDITWQSTVTDIALAGLIGSAFGTVGGVFDARRSARLGEAMKAAEDRLSTLKNVQEARVALNGAIDGLARGEDVALPANAAETIDRVTREVLPTYELRPVPVGEDAIPAGQVSRVIASTTDVGPRPSRPRPLLDFLAGEGGIKDDSGDLDAIGVKRKFVPGRGALVRKTGMELDKAREAAAQAGYFDHIYGTADDAAEKSTVRDLLDLIDQETRGTPAYSMQESARLQAIQDYEAAIANREDYKMFVSELAKTLNELEIGVAVDDNVLARATDIMVQERLSPLDAFDRAVLEDEARFEASLAERGISYRDSDKFSEIPFFDEPSRADDAAGRSAGRAQQDSRTGRRGANEADSRQSSGSRADAFKGIDQSQARPEPAPDGIRDAESRVAKTESLMETAEQYRVDSEDGSFIEQADIDQVRTEGRLTADDEADLADAQQTFDNGVAYGEALKAVAGCFI